MYDQAVEDTPSGGRGVAGVVAGLIVAVAILLAVFIARHATMYRAEARLTYASAGKPLPVEPASGAAMANQALDDAGLARIAAQTGLYGSQTTPAEAARQVRSRLSISQPGASEVKLAFQDADSGRSQSIVNAIATQIAAYRLVVETPAAIQPTKPVPVKMPLRKQRVAQRKGPHLHMSRRDRRAARTQRQMSGVSRPAAAMTQTPDAGKRKELDKIDHSLQVLVSGHAELEAEREDTLARIAAAESSAGAAAQQDATDTTKSERTRIEQQLSSEKAKLADLLDRYTDAYPDVVRTEQHISDLEAREARMPKPAAKPARAESAVSVASLRMDQQREERDLARNDAAVTAEQQRKALLQQQAGRTPAAPSEATEQEPEQKPDQVDVSSTAASTAVVMTHESVAPFSLLQPAQSAMRLGMSKQSMLTWLGAGTALLLVLCLAPLVPIQQDRPHWRASEMQDEKDPAHNHVAYLGRDKDQDSESTRMR